VIVVPELLEIFKAILLGLIEGLTEFLPVSSTGHLILLGEGIGFAGPPGHVFEVFIQFGAILAVIAVFFHKLWKVFVTLPSEPASRHFVYAIALAFFPAVVLGVLLHDYIKTVLFSPLVVAIALIVGGVVILAIERAKITPKYSVIEKLPFGKALAIGFIQCLAMVPGVSRSGATIMGALLLGVERKTAAEFSFFLAMPTMLGAASYDLYKNHAALGESDIVLLVIGFLTAFLVALPIAKGLMEFVGKHGFSPFAWYRIALGLMVLAILFWPF
jgi:undecaprenyl-diphosphatase